MSTLYGMLGISDVDTTVLTIGQNVVWDAIQQLIAMHQADLNKATSLFVSGETTDFKSVARLPLGGRMQESDGKTRPDLVKLSGSYDVSFDLRDYRDGMGWDDVAYAYMTAAQLNAELISEMERDINTVRYQLLSHLLLSSNATFNDDRRGSLTVRRLANADGTTYPPQIGATTELTGHTHYASTGYAASAISDTNNPFATIRNDLIKHWGFNNEMVCFIHSDQRAKTEALTAFIPVANPLVTYGTTTNLAAAQMEEARIPGEVIGTINKMIIAVWDYIPTGYIYGQVMPNGMVQAPLMRRVDEPASLRGFQLVAREKEFPLEVAYWRHREGYGVANRLNGYALFLDSGGSYTDPTIA